MLQRILSLFLIPLACCHLQAETVNVGLERFDNGLIALYREGSSEEELIILMEIEKSGGPDLTYWIENETPAPQNDFHVMGQNGAVLEHVWIDDNLYYRFRIDAGASYFCLRVALWNPHTPPDCEYFDWTPGFAGTRDLEFIIWPSEIDPELDSYSVKANNTAQTSLRGRPKAPLNITVTPTDEGPIAMDWENPDEERHSLKIEREAHLNSDWLFRKSFRLYGVSQIVTDWTDHAVTQAQNYRFRIRRRAIRSYARPSSFTSGMIHIYSGQFNSDWAISDWVSPTQTSRFYSFWRDEQELETGDPNWDADLNQNGIPDILYFALRGDLREGKDIQRPRIEEDQNDRVFRFDLRPEAGKDFTLILEKSETLEDWEVIGRKDPGDQQWEVFTEGTMQADPRELVAHEEQTFFQLEYKCYPEYIFIHQSSSIYEIMADFEYRPDNPKTRSFYRIRLKPFEH
ncbi:MAG: hypothetical protein JJT75_07970 [Opitutales bacterium]|nr:hypothetical protein [Opitutales bacterium]MCH8540012.1 hypothetical protein [Opitutales bacterium]